MGPSVNIVIGGSGHAKVLVSTLLLLEQRILGFTDLNTSLPALLGVPNLGVDEAILRYKPGQVTLVNGVGSAGSTHLRRAIYQRFRAMGYSFATVIHPSAWIAPGVQVEEGAQVMAGAIVQPGSWLGENVIINTRSCVDHDCRIEPHAHIAPGATLAGGIHVERGAHIGAGATVIQGLRIGSGAIVGAGAVVLRDVSAGITVAGVPAVPIARAMAAGEKCR